MRMNVPHHFQGPDAIIPVTTNVPEINKPKRDLSLAQRNVLRNKLKKIKINKNIQNEIFIQPTSDT